jgi:hypothetical protein
MVEESGGDGRGEKGSMVEQRVEMAEASSATTNRGDSATRVLRRKTMNCTLFHHLKGAIPAITCFLLPKRR